MTVGVPALAAGFASQFDTIGPYVGFGSLIAVIAMAVLVFSQGRELQRLREWAGTAPERLKALEERLDREERPAAAPARPAVPGVATPGKLAPHPGAQVPAAAAAATAAASGSGAVGAIPPAPPAPPTPGVPGAVPPLAAGTAAAAGPRPPVAGAPSSANPARPTPPGASGAAQPTRAVSAVSGTPRASTPAGRASAAARQREPEPPKRSIAQVIGVSLVGAVVLVGVLFALGVIGGSTESPVKSQNDIDQPKPDAPKPSVKTYSPKQTSVVVLNATGVGGLAKTGSDLLDNKRFAAGKVGDYSENGVPAFKPTTIVAYRSGYGNRDAAKDIAKYLGLKANTVKAMDANVKAAVDGTPKVVVILGQDYAAKTETTPADSNPTGTTPGGTTTDSSGTPGTSGSTGSTGSAGSTGSTGSTPDSSITGDVSGNVNGDVVADTTIGAP